MSEQVKQDTSSQNQEIEDDPLAELARIVAGEPELNPQPQEQPAAVPEPELVEEQSMEAALEEQLKAEFSAEETQAVDVEPPAFVEDINESINQAVAEGATPTQVPAEPASMLQEDNTEVGFQDSLINALEMEVTGHPEPQPETYVEPAQVTAEPVEELVETQPVMPVQEYVQEEVSQVEDVELDMQEALEQELSAQFEPEQPDLPEETFIHPQEVAPAAVIEEDLGAAFASEFEQISEQQPMPEPSMQETVVEAPVMPEPVMPEPVQQEVAQSEPELEMDFEAAFAQELEGISVPESEGWTETTTEDANAAFTAAASPNLAHVDQVQPTPSMDTSDLDAMEYDPGHVGSVDEITAVEASANDNGGGKKYAVAALVIALFAGVIAAGYGFLGGENTTVASGTPEIIKADAEPVKVKPKDPGGIVPENQDNASYVDLGGENNTAVSQQTLNSQTEEPIVINTGNTDEAPKSDDRLVASEDAGATPSASETAVLPKVVQTVTVKPDGTIITKPALPQPVETALNTVTIGDTSNVEVKPVSTQVIKKPEAIDGAKTTGDITVPSASPLPKPVVKPKPAPVKKVAAAPKPKAVTPAPTRKSEWVVQVSSQRTPEAAQSSFVNMRNRFSALQGRAMSIQRANVNGTTYYRVRVQTASRDDANQLCSRLASAGGSCFVTR